MRFRMQAMVLLLVCAALAQGQPPAAPANEPAALRTDLKRLGAAAQSLQQDLPSFACKETGLSEAIKKNKVKQRVRFAGDLRVVRGRESRLNEDLDVTDVNGKPTAKAGFEPPFMVRGGFGDSLSFFLPVNQTCFRYTLSGDRIDFKSPPGSFERRECGEMGAPDGFVLLDEAGNVTHLERQVPAEHAPQVHVVDFAAIDFVPTELDGKVYPLPAKMVAEVPREGGITLHFEAEYSGCHLFKATSTVLPGATPVPEDGRPQP